MKEQILEVIATEIGLDRSQVTNKSNLINDLGMDSLDGAELIMALEDKFKIEVSDKMVENMKTVGDVIKYVERKIVEKEN